MRVIRVFVYGTLLSGEPNHLVLDGARFVGEARTEPRFSLHDMGPYPAMVADGEHAIVGEVYEVRPPLLARLDRLEGHPHFYRRSVIVLADATAAETYLLAPTQVAGRPTIASGTWRRRKERTGW